MAVKPRHTRLRYISAKEPQAITDFLNQLEIRVQIYGSPQWNGKKWYLWVVPPDDNKIDLSNVDLDQL